VRGAPVGPGLGLFELGGKAQKGCFISIATDELRADGESGVVPDEGHGHGGIARDVEERGVADGTEEVGDVGVLVGVVETEASELQWGTAMVGVRRQS